MIDIVDRLRATADFGIPDYTNSKLLREASDEITRLRAELAAVKADCEHGYSLAEVRLAERDALREENARLLAANKDLQFHFDVVEEDLKKANQENARLREERDKAVEEMWKASDQAQAFRKMAEERKA